MTSNPPKWLEVSLGYDNMNYATSMEAHLGTYLPNNLPTHQPTNLPTYRTCPRSLE